MKPILVNGIDSFVSEPDAILGEQALAANLKLVEGVVATYPDDRDFLQMAAMARATYAFGFVQDDLEAARIARPADRAAHARLLTRVLDHYARARTYAERALRLDDDFADRVGDAALESLPNDAFEAALDTLAPDDATALFWLAFAWGGALQASLDPAEATQLPKLEAMVERVLVLDDTLFYGVGPHMMAGAFYGFRAPALGGDPERAAHHFDLAKERGDLLIPDVLKAQWVFAQTERAEAFRTTLRGVVAAPPRPDRALLETLAKKKACRLLANLDSYFLEDAEPVPDACMVLPHKYPLRADPLDPAEDP